jgi:hypothetical protein
MLWTISRSGDIEPSDPQRAPRDFGLSLNYARDSFIHGGRLHSPVDEMCRLLDWNFPLFELV